MIAKDLKTTLELWGKTLRGGLPPEPTGVWPDLFYLDRVAGKRATVRLKESTNPYNSRPTVWDPDVEAVHRAIMHEAYSKIYRRVLLVHYVSRYRDDIAAAKARRAGLATRDKYNKALRKAHEALENILIGMSMR